MPESPCPNKSINERTCQCTEKNCERHGVCCECIRYHLASGALPACARDKFVQK